MDTRTFILTLLGMVLSSTVVSALITGFWATKREKKKSHHGVHSGVRVLLYDRIKFLGKAYIAKGSVEPDALEDLIDMHKIYHDELEGNGFLDKIMADVRALPVVGKERK